MKGQLSAEMLILIVVVLAVVAIASVQLIGTAKETSENIGKHTDRLNQLTSEAVKSPEGGFCTDDEDCEKGMGCEEYRCG
ncbi:class III signal peptide-containing protein [Candidatus Micrarchaeota archaeon]|nr:class III signal peptide-containing protein [Candidatus Micrarchaeota archaeon]